MTTTTLAAKSGTTRWTIDPTHTNIEFGVRHLMISTVKGRFGVVEGTVNVPSGDPVKAQIDVTIDASGIDTGVDKRDDHLRSPDFLDVARFPRLTFKSKRIERTGTDTFRVHGDLQIRDVTREVQLDVHALGTARDPWGGERAGYQATTRINRHEFGLDWNQALETGGVLVGADVSITLEVQLVQQSA
jgi:polyisoprenoid-binding protein YceI